MVGEHFDSSSEHRGQGGPESMPRGSFLGVHFACCNVYARVYVNRAGSHYVGYCPALCSPDLDPHRPERVRRPVFYCVLS